jgi:acetate---CoA ligase (ADP-forming)
MIPESLFSPASVAVIGSTSPGKLGAVLIQQLLDGGYKGKLAAVNPKGQGYNDVEGYTLLKEIGTPIEAVVIASPASTVPAVLEECGKNGVKTAIIITAGFKEVGNQIGEEKVLSVAKQYGIRIIGPNCAGLCNTAYQYFPTLEVQPPSGSVALISQSGAIAGSVLAGAARMGLGISKFVNYGNGSDLNVTDFLDYFREDDETAVVGVYIESVPDGRAFINALAACCSVKPVLVIKSGRTETGKRATASHTGSMAGADAVYDAVLQQAGAIRVKSVDELLHTCKGFAALGEIKGKRTLIVTNSGGPGVLTADTADELGLKISEPSSEIQNILSEFLPDQCSLRNPIDLTVQGDKEGYQNTVEVAAEEYDAVIAVNITTPYLNADDLARGLIAAKENTGIPVLAHFGPQQFVTSSVKLLEEAGIATFESGEQAAAVLSRMVAYYKNKANLAGRSWPAWKDKGEAAFEPGAVLEPQAVQWLQANDIPVPENRFCMDQASVRKACKEMGYPLVMKVVSPQILHKSEVGGVIMNIQNEKEAKRAFKTIQKRTEDQGFRGVMLYPMFKDAQEVLVGLIHDPHFGPVVVFGLGGIFTEIWKDVVLRVAPLTEEQALEMIHAIRGIKVLQGYRGKVSSDFSAMAELLVKFSKLPFEYSHLAEIDLNPIFVFEKGLMVGDVRIIQS